MSSLFVSQVQVHRQAHRSMRKSSIFCSLLVSGTLALPCAFAQDTKVPFPPAVTLDRHHQSEAPVLTPEMIAPGRYRMGTILIDKADKSVSFPAEINMSKGLLEYLLVRNGGKTHESLLRTEIDPYSLQIAMLLVGMEGTDGPLLFQGDPNIPRGESIEVMLRLEANAANPIHPEAWLTQVVGDAKRVVPPLDWVYTGSVVRNGRFAAQYAGSIVALYHDPVAMVDNASAGGESNRIWFVNEDSTPPVGTPVKVIIRSKKSDSSRRAM